MVARKLCKMMAEHPTLLQHATSKSTGSRPLLVILDRNADLITPVQHCSTYQALIDDVLQHKANRVEFSVPAPESSRNKKPVAKRYDLDPDTDPFYAAHKFQPFPEAIEENGTELQDVTAREQTIRSQTSGAPDLATAVDSLPALLERKQQLEVHTSILQAVMTEVAARDVPQFFEVEYKLATGSYDAAKAKKDVSAMVSDESKSNISDKLRLILVYALATGATPADMDEVASLLEAAPIADKQKVAQGLKAIAYIKQLRSMHMLPSSMLQELQESPNDTGRAGGTLSSLMAKATTQATGFLAKASDRVSSMLGKIHKNHATCVVENLCEPSNASQEDATYLYLDPKARTHEVDVSKLLSRSPVREAIAFVIGGGCYGEYQNLQQMLANERRTIRYGSTEILDPESFTEQLAQLG